jgi:tRNA (guanine-N7-)-methyltransferase
MNDTVDRPEGRPLRTVKSFVRRQGRLTPSQEKALADQWSRYGLSVASGEIDPVSVFGRQAPVILEIGFGNGDTLLELIGRDPARDFIGVEVHQPGVGRLLGEASKRGADNLRVYAEDAVDVLRQCLPEASLDGVLLFFPDPWHKKKHNKRRIVQPAFVQLLRSRLKPGGFFHMATDWEAYALHMMEVMSSAEGFRNEAGDGLYIPRPDTRPVTKFEKRGERLGHGVWDLIFVREA